jgi:predicted RNA-binding Zn-ribbon protein involved in translation (DUF1610 family)
VETESPERRVTPGAPGFVTTIVTTASAGDIHIMADGHTPVVFSREEVREIREALETGAEASCPHCGRALIVHGPVARGGTQGPVWRVRCEECRRVASITEVPQEPSNQKNRK